MGFLLTPEGCGGGSARFGNSRIATPGLGVSGRSCWVGRGPCLPEPMCCTENSGSTFNFVHFAACLPFLGRARITADVCGEPKVGREDTVLLAI